MRPEELMIGDWVEVPFLEGKPKIVKVEEILFDEINPDWEGMENCGGVKIKYVNPIPLTPEILEKNGFYHETNVGYINDDYNGWQIIYDFLNYNLKIIYNYKTILDIEGWLDHIHVHELQHALKLCGIDKTIEL